MNDLLQSPLGLAEVRVLETRQPGRVRIHAHAGS